MELLAIVSMEWQCIGRHSRFPELDFGRTGSVYRVNLTTGQQVWRSGAEPNAAIWTDGGAAIGPNGVIYSVSSLGNQNPLVSDRGGLHAFNIKDGQLLWEHKDLEAGIFTWPVVAQLGENAPLSVITGVGSLAGFPYQMGYMFGVLLLGPVGMLLGMMLWCIRNRCSKSCCAFRIGAWALGGAFIAIMLVLPFVMWYVMPNKFPYNISAYAADSGQPQWRVDLPTYHWPSAAGDEEGFLTRLWHMSYRPIALPCASSYPTVDSQGIIYLAHLDGNIYSIKDWNHDGVIDKETELCSFSAGAAGFTAGPSVAPGLLAVATTDTLYVFGE
eukprot:gnl/TRDRNA2_/TRDRNA2_68510_c0_seq1.p1 gnl/TRDRNA2_/TRDRNA2_68510_c0~~gnl/TRDRNA2_/TRDRNA2_68510_c0_seq1.p1  ORF type:complete len:328 (+),score=31.74 gnl/TRDRNA2_/TRDRNA2_68510_c0_seq1:80-1063(+)